MALTFKKPVLTLYVILLALIILTFINIPDNSNAHDFTTPNRVMKSTEDIYKAKNNTDLRTGLLSPTNTAGSDLKFIDSKYSNAEQNGKIMFLRYKSPGNFEIITLDVNTNRLIFSGNSAGVVSISKDGKNIATSCVTWNRELTEPEGDDHICIISTDEIYDDTHIVSMPIARPPASEEFALPSQCSVHEERSKILSLSWSPDNKTLAFVCGNLNENKTLCTMNLNGESNCKDLATIDKSITTVDWSPNGLSLALGGSPNSNSKIIIIDPKFNHYDYLTIGWGPKWSIDGKKIAFIKYTPKNDDADPYQIGIWIIDPITKKQYWLYLSPPGELWGTFFLDLCYEDPSGVCHIAWSPSGNYLVFISPTLNVGNTELIRLDVHTKEMINLVDNAVIDKPMHGAEWGAWEISEELINTP